MKRIVSVMLACIMALALLAGCGSKGSGKKISFEGTDLNGNTVTSSEIFGNNKVTMVNLWSSTCKGCEDELAQLQDLGDRVAGAGGQVIGVIMDTDMDNAVEKCSAKLQSHGATYTNVVATEKMREDLATNVYPLTYFVDSEGNVLLDLFIHPLALVCSLFGKPEIEFGQVRIYLGFDKRIEPWKALGFDFPHQGSE